MGIFGTIEHAVTGPFRGVGYLAQGKIRKAAGAFGDTAKVAVPIIAGATGVGLPVAAAMGAAGGAAESWGNGQNNIGKIALGAGGGAAGAAAGHYAGDLLRGGAPGGSAPSGTVATDLPQAAGGYTDGIEAMAGSPASGSLPRGTSFASNIGKFAMKNPEATLYAAGLPLQAAGMEQQGAAADQAQALQELEAKRREDERQRRYKLDQMGNFAQSLSAMRPRY